MQKNVILQLARFGDILQSRRLIKSLQEKGSLSLCVDKSQEKLAKLTYPEAEILPIQAFNADKKTLLAENKKIFEYIKNEAYTSAYIMNHSPMSYAFAHMFDYEQLRGYTVKNGQEMRSDWVKLAFVHMRNRYEAPLHIVDYWAYFADNPIAPEKVNPSAKEKSNALFNTENSPQQMQIAIVLAGQEMRRSIPVAKYVQIIKVFLSRFKHTQAQILLLGTPKEEGLARDFMVECGHAFKDIKNLVGKTSMEELYTLINECDFLISPDTGTLHLATFLGVPTLSFYFSSAFCFETGPYGLGHKCVQILPSCAPCLEKAKCNNYKCHETLSSPALLARLAGKKTQKEINDFSILESSFDKVGVTYTQEEGILKERKEAQILRNLLYEFREHDISFPQSEKVALSAGNLYDALDFFPHNKTELGDYYG